MKIETVPEIICFCEKRIEMPQLWLDGEGFDEAVTMDYEPDRVIEAFERGVSDFIILYRYRTGALAEYGSR